MLEVLATAEAHHGDSSQGLITGAHLRGFVSSNRLSNAGHPVMCPAQERLARARELCHCRRTIQSVLDAAHLRFSVSCTLGHMTLFFRLPSSIFSIPSLFFFHLSFYLSCFLAFLLSCFLAFWFRQSNRFNGRPVIIKEQTMSAATSVVVASWNDGNSASKLLRENFDEQTSTSKF